MAARDRKDRKETEGELVSAYPGISELTLDFFAFFAFFRGYSFSRTRTTTSTRTTSRVRSGEPLAREWNWFQNWLGESFFQNAPYVGSFIFGKSQTRRSG